MDRYDVLKYDVDIINGELLIPKPFNGILDAIRNGGREYTYMTGSFGMQEFRRLIKSMNPLNCFDDLFQFEHFNKMADYDTSTELDKILYLHAREWEIKAMKRLRAYVEVENEYYLNN